jgi:beta-lactam-binding protein with PASTA domain
LDVQILDYFCWAIPKQLLMGFRKFITSRDFFRHLGLIALVFAIVVYATFLSLKYYTHHGQSISVPDLSGMDESEVDKAVGNLHLRYAISDSVYIADAIPGTVIDQHPDPGYRVKSRRKVFVTLAAFEPEKVNVPSVTDVSLREAISRLQNAGLALGMVEYRPSEFPNLVLDQLYLGTKIHSDTVLPKGSAIDLIVGRGGGMERTGIPDLFGLSIGEARKLLFAHNLDMGALVFDDSFIGNEDTTGARVYRQSPKAIEGLMITQGTMVDVCVSKYEELFVVEVKDTITDEADAAGGL